MMSAGSSTRKRQRTGAIQNLADFPAGLENREASWTAVVLYRFTTLRPVSEASGKNRIRPLLARKSRERESEEFCRKFNRLPPIRVIAVYISRERSVSCPEEMREQEDSGPFAVGR